MFPLIDALQELIKSYTIAQTYSEARARELLTQINKLRLEIALDAEGREIFYDQQIIPFAANANWAQSVWYSRNDIEYVLRRAVAQFTANAQIALVNQGSRRSVITRESIGWQSLWSQVQNMTALTGQQKPFNYPQELFFSENESLGITVRGQITNNAWLVHHGCTLKDTIEDVRVNHLTAEIERYVPNGSQLVPLTFQFPAAVAGSIATNVSGGEQIMSSKNSQSVILTHFSTNATQCRITLQDTGRNQLIAQDVEMRGIAGDQTNPLAGWYPLPYPHLLRAGDRLRLNAVNGTIIPTTAGASVVAANTPVYLVAKGYAV